MQRWREDLDVDEPVTGALVSRVRLSAWLRVVFVVSFGLLAAVVTSSVVQRLTTTGPDRLAALEIGVAVVAAVLLASSVVASCTVRVTPERVTLGYWILFRATIRAGDLAEIRADRWNCWDYGGHGLKGGPKQGWLLNATADGFGGGDIGIYLRTTTGRVYRVEVRDPHRFVEQAVAVLGAR